MSGTLFGCATSDKGLAPISLPVLPADLALACRDPGVRAGQPALGELARNRLALAECSRKHRDTVTFYEELRTGFAK
jgi:hypothetical protein